MRAYSLDLRERVIAMLQEEELSQPQIADHLHVSLGTVENWWRLWRKTGSLAPQPFVGGAKRTLEPCEAVIRAAVAHQPDATLTELCNHVQATAGVRANATMMCRELQILNLPRKKVTARQPTRHPAGAKVATSFSKRHPATAAPRRRPSEIHR